MKQYIRTYLFLFSDCYCCICSEPGHEVHIVVTSAKDVKLTPVRDAFTHVFGRATTQGIVSLVHFLLFIIKLDLFRVFNRMLLLNQSVSKLVLKVSFFPRI
jgi:hypothetical protein